MHHWSPNHSCEIARPSRPESDPAQCSSFYVSAPGPAGAARVSSEPTLSSGIDGAELGAEVTAIIKMPPFHLLVT